MLNVKCYILAWSVLITTATINSIAHRCSMLIQPPGETDSFDAFFNELEQNCFQYYNVRVDNATMSIIKHDYNDVIHTSKNYSLAYVTNERLLYSVQAWISTVVDDPLSTVQRQLKDCNAQLLVNTFNLDDMINTMPIFINGQEYMRSCFADARDQIQELKTDIEHDCTEQIAETGDAAQLLRDRYLTMALARQSLAGDRATFKQNIIDGYNRIRD